MTDSNFNPELFEQIAIEGENQTSFIPVPEGDYPAYVEGYAFRKVEVNGQENVLVEIDWVIPDEALAKELGLEELKVNQAIWLDLTADNAIDFGTNKNVGLGRLRQALNLNDAKSPFQWSSLQGQAATITIRQTAKKDDPSIIYSNVAKVAPPVA